MVSESDLFKIYQALGNAHRRNIIALLGENPDGLTFSELRKMVNLSVGSLYYNLDQLEDLIYQKNDKRYALTEKGFLAYNILKSDIERLKSGEPLSGLADFTSKLRGLLLPRWFFAFLENKKGLTTLIAIIILLTGAIVCGYNGIMLSVTWVGYSSMFFLNSLSFILSWIAISVATFAIAPSNVKRKLRLLPRYLIEVGLAMFPLATFVAIEPFLRSVVIVKVAIQVILWLISISLISSALSHVAKCRSEIAFLITALVMFIATLAVSQLVLFYFME
ncbi:MAG: winged helix-turn-helix domain-containing protein [Candidatus Nezhaarchaeales archaeon]